MQGGKQGFYRWSGLHCTQHSGSAAQGPGVPGWVVVDVRLRSPSGRRKFGVGVHVDGCGHPTFPTCSPGDPVLRFCSFAAFVLTSIGPCHLVKLLKSQKGHATGATSLEQVPVVLLVSLWLCQHDHLIFPKPHSGLVSESSLFKCAYSSAVCPRV